MVSTRPQNFSIPVFPARPLSVGVYGPAVRYFPDKRDLLPKENAEQDRRPAGDNGSRTKSVIAMVIVGLLLVAVVVVIPVVLSQAYKHQDMKSTTATVDTTTTSANTSTSSTTIISATPSLNSTIAQLIGNFTIMNMNLQSVTASDVCQKITYDITKSGQNANNCQITDLRPGSVKVRFQIDVEKEATEDENKALNRASTALALALTNDSTYHVDPRSITFDDPDNRSVVERHCNQSQEDPGQSQQCPGQDVVCISVVDAYVCVCAAGYYRNTTSNGTCTPRGTTESINRQTTFVQTTKSQTTSPAFQTSRISLRTSRPDSVTSGPGLQTSRPDSATSGSGLQTSRPDSVTSGPGLQTSRPNSITPGPDLQTSRPDSVTSGPGLQTSRHDSLESSPSPQTTSRPVTQSSRAYLQTSVSDLNATLTSSVAVMTSIQSTMLTTTVCVGFCAPTQKCIPSNQLCDKYQDCPDDSDEINCVCDRNHYHCKNGRCIYKTWLCDGVKDCPMGDDESPPQCNSCNSSDFTCGKPRSCLAQTRHCDGVTDCSDSSDESSCFKIDETSEYDNLTMASVVTVIYRGKPGFHICSDNWNETWSDSVCKQTGHEMSSSTSYLNAGLNESFLVLDLSVSASNNLLDYLQISNCSSNLAVAVSCVLSVCGRRAVSPNMVGPYILNGERAQRGAWPWQVLHLSGNYSPGGGFQTVATCGGTLINDRWILTAGHCNMVNYAGLGYTGQLKPANVLVMLGSLSRSGDADAVYASVDSVFVNPSFSPTPAANNDVGLVRLSAAVTFTDTIRPICLPNSTEDLSQIRVCVDTGFGRTLRNALSDDLLQARMNILSYTDCQNYLRNSFLRDQTQFCVGTIPTEADINFCQGDSGGPLSCQGQDGLWKVIGINSYVLGTNDGTSVNTCYLSIATRVTQFVDWVQQTISANSV